MGRFIQRRKIVPARARTLLHDGDVVWTTKIHAARREQSHRGVYPSALAPLDVENSGHLLFTTNYKSFKIQF
jgi:hypothetical protein